MQQLDFKTRALIYAGVISIVLVTLLVLARAVQQMVIQHRETGSFWSTTPDTPAMRRFERVNGIIFGSIRCVVGIIATFGAAYLSWAYFQDGNVRTGSFCLLALPVTLYVTFTGGFFVWRAFRPPSRQ